MTTIDELPRSRALEAHYPVCSSSFGSRDPQGRSSSGDNGEGAPPVPIPNTAVKAFSADGTASFRRGRVGRRRILKRKARQFLAGLFFSERRCSRAYPSRRASAVSSCAATIGSPEATDRSARRAPQLDLRALPLRAPAPLESEARAPGPAEDALGSPARVTQLRASPVRSTDDGQPEQAASAKIPETVRRRHCSLSPQTQPRRAGRRLDDDPALRLECELERNELRHRIAKRVPRHRTHKQKRAAR